MTELYAVRITSVFAANSHLQLGIGLAALLDSPAHEHAYPPSVEALERVSSKHPGLLFVHIVWEEASRIVTGQSHRCLRQVIGTEREELRHFGDLSGKQSGARQLNHRAHQVWQLHASLLDQVVGDSSSSIGQDCQLFFIKRERNHDLR